MDLDETKESLLSDMLMFVVRSTLLVRVRYVKATSFEQKYVE